MPNTLNAIVACLTDFQCLGTWPCPRPHTTHLHRFHILYNLTIVRSPWKNISFLPETFTRNYVKIAYFNNSENTFQERSIVLQGLFFFPSQNTFHLSPTCYHISWEHCRAQIRCYTARLTVKKEKLFKKKKYVRRKYALPVLMPSVIIHAPVVSAALTRPWLKISLSLEGILKLWMPPWTEITSFGSSIFHSFNIKCNRCSNFVS